MPHLDPPKFAPEFIGMLAAFLVRRRICGFSAAAYGQFNQLK
jgi:hypothetical protein